MVRFRLPFTTPERLRRDIDDELAFHLSVSAEELERQRLSPAEARAEAEARLGDLPALRRALYRIDSRFARERKLMTWLDELRQDLRFSLRRARHRPLLLVLVVLTLAIGTGTVMTFFGAADTILLRPLPIVEPDRVMTIWRAPAASADVQTELSQRGARLRLPGRGNDAGSEIRTGLAPGTVMDLVEESRTFSAIAAAEPWGYDITVDGVARSVGAWRVTEGFFDIFLASPHAGRLLGASDFLPGGPAVAVVGYDFFRNRLAGDPAVVGATTLLGGEPYLVVGVLPPDFPILEGRQLFTPLVISGAEREERRQDYFRTFGRLRPGMAIEAGREDLREVARRSDARIVGSQTARALHVIPLADSMFGSSRPALTLLALGAFLLLLMAATNAAGLMVADTLDRYRELAVRASVGAGRGRIVRQLATEAMALAFAAGAVGFALGVAGLRAFQRWAPADLPRVAELGVDLRLAAIATGVVLILALIMGLLPAWLVTRAGPLEGLKESGSPWGGSVGRRIRLMLVGTQVTLASVLLGSGGLLVRSWVMLQAEDQGYQADGVIALQAHVWHLFPDPQARVAMGIQVPQVLAARPGAVAAALASSLPLAATIGNEWARIGIPGMEEEPTFRAVVATPGIFELLRIPVMQGRGFETVDAGDGEPIVVLSRSAAATLFPGEDPVGRTVNVSWSGPPVPRRIVGVVEDVRFSSPAAPSEPALYLPHAQAPTGSFYVVTGYPGNMASAAADAERAFREVFAGGTVEEVLDLGILFREAVAPRRFGMLLLTSFATISLVLTAVGLFGLLAQSVRARRRELGIRMAVGARPVSLRNMVVVEGLRLTGKGLVVGIALFLLLSGLLGGVLYGVPPHDPITVAGVAVLVLTVAALASWWPARQATRVDPMRVLRNE